METELLKMPLTKAQLEILKLFTIDMEEIELKELKRLLVKFLAEKLTKLTNEVWEQNNWTNQDMDNLLNTHLRTPYIR